MATGLLVEIRRAHCRAGEVGLAHGQSSFGHARMKRVCSERRGCERAEWSRVLGLVMIKLGIERGYGGRDERRKLELSIRQHRSLSTRGNPAYLFTVSIEPVKHGSMGMRYVRGSVKLHAGRRERDPILLNSVSLRVVLLILRLLHPLLHIIKLHRHVVIPSRHFPHGIVLQPITVMGTHVVALRQPESGIHRNIMGRMVNIVVIVGCVKIQRDIAKVEKGGKVVVHHLSRGGESSFMTRRPHWRDIFVHSFRMRRGAEAVDAGV